MTANLHGDPIQVDERMYARFSEANVAFHRLSVPQSEWREKQSAKTRSLALHGRTAPKGPPMEPGDALLDYAMRESLGAIRQLATPHFGRFDGVGSAAQHPSKARADLDGLDVSDPVKLSEWIKRVARICGAALVGIAPLDARWVYSELRRSDEGEEDTVLKPLLIEDVPRPLETEEALFLPSAMRHAIVVAVAMDRGAILTAPSMLADAATGLGYSQASALAVLVARAVQAAGYQAMPSLNDTALTIPIAVQAGLGEPGRNGLLVTPQNGPCVRLAKVLTDMPLIPDGAAQYGIRECCEVCRACVDGCPANAISRGAPTLVGHNECNSSGVLKWHVDAKRCLGYWIASGTSCSACIARCPWTRGTGCPANSTAG